MNESFQAYPSLESALNAQYRGHADRDWEEWKTWFRDTADEVAPDADRAWIGRGKHSYRGIDKLTSLKHLIAGGVDQPALDEIGQLYSLERLELEHPLAAADLTPLTKLTNLRHLSIDTPRNVMDFEPLLRMPALRTLLITNAKHLSSLDWLSDAHHLEVLGIEGSIWTKQKIPSLEPIGGLRSLRALFATSVQLADKSLLPLAQCPALRFIGCARFAPRQSFEELRQARPDLVCGWFDEDRWKAVGGRAV